MNRTIPFLPLARRLASTVLLATLATVGVALAQTAPEPIARAQAFRPSTEGCRYTKQEIETTLGFATQDGRGNELRAGDNRQLMCSYFGQGTPYTLALTQVFASIAVTRDDARNMVPGRFDRIEGDADGAGWHTPPADRTGDLILAYLRNGVWTTLRLSGLDAQDEAQRQALRQRLLALRRLP